MLLQLFCTLSPDGSRMLCDIPDVYIVGPQHWVQLSLDEAQGSQVHLVPFEESLGKQGHIRYLSGAYALCWLLKEVIAVTWSGYCVLNVILGQ